MDAPVFHYTEDTLSSLMDDYSYNHSTDLEPENGSHLPIVANLYMESFERKAIVSAINPPLGMV